VQEGNCQLLPVPCPLNPAANWDTIYAKMIEEGMIEKKPVDLEDKENYLVELYFTLMTQLKRSRRVVCLRR